MGWEDVYRDVQRATGRTAKWGPDYFGKVYNEAGANGWLIRHILNKRDYRELMTSSDRIVTTLMFDEKADGSFHNPGVPRRRDNPQVLTQSQVNFAYQDQPLVWLHQEVIFNQGGTRKERKTRYADTARQKTMRSFHSMLRVSENSMFDVPDFESMETVPVNVTRLPYSIFAFANESQGYSATATQAAQTTALAGHTGAFNLPVSGSLTSNWTTVAGVSVNEARWRNQVFEYRHASTTIDGVDGNGDNLYDGTGLIRAFNDAFLYGNFETPTAEKGEFELDSDRMHIITGNQAINLWLRVSSAAGGNLGMRFTNMPDVYGVPMVRAQAFEDAPVYANGDLTGLVSATAGTALGGAATDSASWGPRFLFWNNPKAHPVWHQDRMMKQIAEYQKEGAEDVEVSVFASWWNWCPASRQRLVMVRGNMSAATSAGV